jgi:hypothetical protein
MRNAAWLISALLATTVFGGQVDNVANPCRVQPDPYHIAFVKSAFKSFKESEKLGAMTSFQLKYFTNNFPSLTELGDSATVAVLKNYTLDELALPENTKPYVTIVSLSFSDRARVLDRTDRSPRVTSVILDYLQQRVPEQRTKTIIEKLKKCTPTCSCPRIPNF